MRFRRRSARLLGAMVSVILVTFGVVAAPPAAFASTPCPDGQICFYKDHHGQGQISIQAHLNGPPFGISDFRHSHYRDQTSLNDSISSIINNTPDCLYLWPDVDLKPGAFHGSSVIIPHSGTEGGVNFPDDAVSSAIVQAQPCVHQ